MRPLSRWARAAAVAAAVVVAAGLASGAGLDRFDVRTSGGFLFDVMVDSSFGMLNGLSDAYDGCYMLRVAGAEVQPRSGAILFGGRGVGSPLVAAGPVEVSRQVFVPEQGDWARYFDLVVNRSKTAQTVDVELYGNLGSDSSTKIVSTSDGDQLFETTDRWLATDDHGDGSGDPSLAHVFRRTRGKLAPSAVALEMDDLSVRFRLELRPGRSAAIVLFAVQTRDEAEASRLAAELADFGPAARARLDRADIALIAN